MTKSIVYVKRFIIGLMVFLQVAFFPAAALAEEGTTPPEGETPDTSQIEEQQTPPEEETPPAVEEEEEETPPAVQQQTSPEEEAPPASTPTKTIYGPDRPNGAAGDTFKYNEKTGLWENDYYTWDQLTQTTRPKKAPVYTYNPATGMWDSVQWIYQAHTGKYAPFTVSYDHNPGPSALSRSASISGSGQASGNTINNTYGFNGQFDYYNTSGITNYISSTAFTGDATVYANTYGGSAKSGNALTAANILNLLQSSWAPYTATFEANIDGNVRGDLMINPSGSDSNNEINVDNNTNLETNIVNDTEINNNVYLRSESGDATVEANTQAGDATSGDADAMVNIINMLNSMIETGQSFVGTININGDFEGDILLPENLLNYLIAHTGPGSNNTINNENNSNLDVSVSDTVEINNNVNASAQTGDANVVGNTNGGNAKSGNATTSITILNLTGKQIVAENALLVFINVHGSWVGAIVNAPAGSTAAALSNTGPNSNNTINSTNNVDQEVNIDNRTTINNNVTVEAETGDATVKNNTNAGNATSGNATASVNIANITGSNLKLRNWFGVLFINVFGSWKGSFGVNTAYGNAPAKSQAASQAPATAAATTASTTSSSPKTFAFIPKTSSTSTNTPSPSPAVASAATDNNSTPQFTDSRSSNGSGSWVAIGGVAIALGLIGLERFLTLRRNSGK